MLQGIETERLVIRPFSLDDVKTIFILSQEEGMRTWIPDQVYKDEMQTTDVLNFLMTQYEKENPKEAPVVFAIALKDSKEVIGHVGLSAFEENVEIGYAIGEKHGGKGYATEAVKAYTEWALKTLPVKKIYGIVANENHGSGRVLEKAGYILEEEKEQMYLGKPRMCRRFYME